MCRCIRSNKDSLCKVMEVPWGSRPKSQMCVRVNQVVPFLPTARVQSWGCWGTLAPTSGKEGDS